MVQKLLLSSLLLIFTNSLKAQDLCVTSLFNTFESGEVYLSIQGGTRFTDEHLPQPYFGINPQILVSQYIGLNYSFGFGKNYGHIPFFGAGFWSTVAVDFAAGDDALCALFVLALLPEGFTFHIPLKQHIKISPYINFMGSERLKGEYGDFTDTYRGAYNFGTHVMYSYDNAIVSPYVEFSGLFQAPVTSLRLGLSLGWIL